MSHQIWTRDVERQVNNSSGGAGHTRVRCSACLIRAGKIDYDRSCSVNMRNGWIKCHRCGWRSRLSWFSEEDFGWEDAEQEAEETHVELPSDYHPITAALMDFSKAPHLYLHGRRVPSSVVASAGLGYAFKGKHKGRIIMPAVQSDDWRTVGWVGRYIGQSAKKRRYHQAEGMDTRCTFYNDDELSEDVDKPLVVVEGPFDALAHWPHTLGSWGKPKQPQLKRLARVERPIVFVGDGDARRDFFWAAEVLRAIGRKAWAVELPAKVDPGDLPRKVLDAAVQYCITHQMDTRLS